MSQVLSEMGIKSSEHLLTAVVMLVICIIVIKIIFKVIILKIIFRSPWQV